MYNDSNSSKSAKNDISSISILRKPNSFNFVSFDITFNCSFVIFNELSDMYSKFVKYSNPLISVISSSHKSRLLVCCNSDNSNKPSLFSSTWDNNTSYNLVSLIPLSSFFTIMLVPASSAIAGSTDPSSNEESTSPVGVETLL